MDTVLQPFSAHIKSKRGFLFFLGGGGGIPGKQNDFRLFTQRGLTSFGTTLSSAKEDVIVKLSSGI